MWGFGDGLERNVGEHGRPSGVGGAAPEKIRERGRHQKNGPETVVVWGPIF
jgi:hypothetical protein